MEISRNEMQLNENHPTLTAAAHRIERLKVRHFRLLDLVARRGSLSAAAEALHISQPGATKLLHELETALGLALVERNARGGQLNPQGRHVLDRLRVALGAVDAATAALDNGPELPLVRLGLLPLVGLDALSRVVVDLSQAGQLPRLALQLGTVEQLVRFLSEAEVDGVVGVLGGDVTPQMLEPFHITPLWNQSTVVVVTGGHPLARRRQVRLEDLRDHDWVLMPQSSASRKAFDRAFLAAGLVPPAARIETESFHIALDLVAHTQMLAVVPIGAFRHRSADLRQVRIVPAFPTSTVVMLTPRGPAPELPALALLREAFLRVAPAMENARAS